MSATAKHNVQNNLKRKLPEDYSSDDDGELCSTLNSVKSLSISNIFYACFKHLSNFRGYRLSEFIFRSIIVQSYLLHS